MTCVENGWKAAGDVASALKAGGKAARGVRVGGGVRAFSKLMVERCVVQRWSQRDGQR